MSIFKELQKLSEQKGSLAELANSDEDVEIDDLAFSASSKESSRRTISDEEFVQLKAQIILLKRQIAEGTFVRSKQNMQTIVAWFRTTREDNFVIVKEKKKREVKPKEPKQKKLTKKELAAQEAERLAAIPLEQLL